VTTLGNQGNRIYPKQGLSQTSRHVTVSIVFSYIEQPDQGSAIFNRFLAQRQVNGEPSNI
jgi:hypothetical protein